MRALWVVTIEAFVLLRRDRVFLPALALALAIGIAANLVSTWSIEEFDKILFDLGLAGFKLMGGIVALFWGVKSVTDARQDGALESQLAWPIGRATWLVGKFFGLALALALLAALSLALWQGLMLLNRFGRLTLPELAAFGGVFLAWQVLGALGVLLAAFLRQSIATFAGVCLWILGLVSAAVAKTLAPQTPPLTARFVKGVARAWDLQQFNLLEHALSGTLPAAELALRAAYGLLMISAMITVAGLVFARRDGT